MANTAIIDFIFNSQGAMKGIAQFQEKLGRSVDAIVSSAAGKMGALGTALIGFSSVKSMISEVKKVADFSIIYGKNIEAISSFNNLMAQFGGNTEESLQVYGQLQDALTQLRTSASGAYKALATKLQINFWDEATGRFKNSAQILQEIRRNWHRLSEEGKQDALKTLGINMPTVRRYLEASNEEMREAVDLASRMPKLTDKSVKSLQRVERAWAIIRGSFIQVGGVILESLSQPIEYLGQASEWLANQSEGVRSSIVGIVAALGMLAPILKLATFLTSGMGLAFKALGFVAANIFGLLTYLPYFILARFVQLVAFLAANPLIAFFMALAGAAYLVYKNWDEIKAYFTQFIGWIGNQASKLGGIFEGIFHNLVEWIKNILSKIPVIGKMINDELKDQEADAELKQGYQSSVLHKTPAQMSMIPQGSMLSGGTTTNNNQRSSVTNTYNVTFNGITNAEDINNSFTQAVRQGSTGVR